MLYVNVKLGCWQCCMTFLVGADGHWVCCPRNALRRAVQLAREQHGVAFRVGFETEFVLLNKHAAPHNLDNLAAIDNSLYCQSSALEDSAGGALCRLAHWAHCGIADRLTLPHNPEATSHTYAEK